MGAAYSGGAPIRSPRKRARHISREGLAALQVFGCASSAQRLTTSTLRSGSRTNGRSSRGGTARARRGPRIRRRARRPGRRRVDVLRERPLVVDQREAVVRAGELHAPGLVVAQVDPGVRRDRRVEALGRLEVGDADPQVVDAAGGAGSTARRARPRHCCRPGRAGSRRSSRVRRSRGPGARRRGSRRRSPPARRRPRPRGSAREADVQPRVTGCSRSVGAMSQSSHSTSSASAWLGSTPSTESTVR